MPLPREIQTTHIQNADTASTVIAAASTNQRVYVVGLFYRNGSGGALPPILVSNAKNMWGGATVSNGGYTFVVIGDGFDGLPVSDGVNQSVTFSSATSATSDLTVWWYYGP